MTPAADPLAPSLVWTYPKPKRALLIRASALEGAKAWTDSAGVRACEVIGLDAKPADAARALIEWREGKAHRKGWVPLDRLASTPAIAAEKLAAHLSALLAAQRPAQMPVTTTTGSAEASAA